VTDAPPKSMEALNGGVGEIRAIAEAAGCLFTLGTSVTLQRPCARLSIQGQVRRQRDQEFRKTGA